MDRSRFAEQACKLNGLTGGLHPTVQGMLSATRTARAVENPDGAFSRVGWPAVLGVGSLKSVLRTDFRLPT